MGRENEVRILQNTVKRNGILTFLKRESYLGFEVELPGSEWSVTIWGFYYLGFDVELSTRHNNLKSILFSQESLIYSKP